jgi:hypothetical protein
MLYREIIVICTENYTIYKAYTLWIKIRIFLMLKLVVRNVFARLC